MDEAKIKSGVFQRRLPHEDVAAIAKKELPEEHYYCYESPMAPHNGKRFVTHQC